MDNYTWQPIRPGRYRLVKVSELKEIEFKVIGFSELEKEMLDTLQLINTLVLYPWNMFNPKDWYIALD